MRDEAQYREYVAARAPALRRTAYLLCGDWHRAEDAVQSVLIALYVHPPKAWEAVDSWVRTALVRKLIDESRRPWRPEQSAEVQSPTLIEPPLAITPDGLLAEGRKRVRRRRLLTITASSLALVGGGALAVSLLTGGLFTPAPVVVTTASTPTGESGSNSTALPSKDAAPAVVLDAYLRALKASDCKTGHALGTSSFADNGELCGQLRVKSYTPVLDPATPGDQAIFSTNLITEGGDASMPDGLHTRFYILTRQAGGAWRVDSAGSGP